MARRLLLLPLLFVPPILGACADPEPPVVEATPIGDTRDTLGPYTVSAIVRENREVAAVRLSFRSAEVDLAEVVAMHPDGERRWTGEIPGYPVGAEVHWFVEAEDADGNVGYAPWQAELGDGRCLKDLDPQADVPDEGAAYCFVVLP